MLNLTPLFKLYLRTKGSLATITLQNVESQQRRVLSWLLQHGVDTHWGADHGLRKGISYEEFADRAGTPQSYEAFRPYVAKMICGAPDMLWPGITRNFAQSSGTSDGKSKFIPVTGHSLRLCHYKGAQDVVANYLRLHPDSRIFSGKALILGGSFANELSLKPGVRVGDLSATLIDKMTPLAELMRVPKKKIALMSDWALKLPALVNAAIKQNITNISGVPSWFLTVLKEILNTSGKSEIHQIWPRLEVFFHGGISMNPYREQYNRIIDPDRMRYMETYNASEGFFAFQTDPTDPAMTLMLDAGTFYEFIPVDAHPSQALPAWKIKEGEVYEMAITSCNGLWRYRLGDTVEICGTNPLKIRIAGRTKSFINAFGEELMVFNADAAVARVSQEMGCEVANYTAAPVYAGDHSRGRHEWIVEFNRAPDDMREFAARLDKALQAENSDYQAKRASNIFLDQLTVVPGKKGVFDRWLGITGRLGGQRKVPRLCNDRHIIEQILAINS